MNTPKVIMALNRAETEAKRCKRECLANDLPVSPLLHRCDSRTLLLCFKPRLDEQALGALQVAKDLVAAVLVSCFLALLCIRPDMAR